VRVLKCTQDEETKKTIDRIYKSFCGYVNANYAHVMEIYYGPTDSFNITGVPSEAPRKMRMAHINLAAGRVLHAAAFIAHTLGLKDLHHDIVQCWLKAESS
jgi:hypothetical protein